MALFSREFLVFLGAYSCFCREYKRPIVRQLNRFKNGTVMQATSSPRESVRPDTTVINVERFAILRSFFPQFGT